LLLVELDGPVAEVEALMRHVDEICRKNGAWEVRLAQTDTERMLVWKGRKAAFAAMGRISPNYIVQDGVIPRTALPRVMSEIARLSAETGLRVAIPWFFTTAASRVRSKPPNRFPIRFLSYASQPVAPSLANTASVKKRNA
jgi:FAD/FMN-containing dehydrogenase